MARQKSDEETKQEMNEEHNPEEQVAMVEPIDDTQELPASRGDKRPKTLTHCWNCKKRLNSENICDNCGFELDKLHNVFLETDKQKYAESRGE